MRFTIFIKWLFGKNTDRYKRSVLDIISENVRLSCYWNWKMREPGFGCKGFYSGIASRKFGLDGGSCANSMIGYIEFLELEVKRLNENNGKQ